LGRSGHGGGFCEAFDVGGWRMRIGIEPFLEIGLVPNHPEANQDCTDYHPLNRSTTKPSHGFPPTQEAINRGFSSILPGLLRSYGSDLQSQWGDHRGDRFHLLAFTYNERVILNREIDMQTQTTSFQTAVELVEVLSIEDQIALIDLFQKRLVHQKRSILTQTITDVRAEVENGAVKFGSVDDFLAELDES
jgi:hypothetical protein